MRDVVDGQGSEDSGILYAMWAERGFYLGKGSVRRASGPGFRVRLLEHWLEIFCKQGKHARYKLFRHGAFAKFFMLPLLVACSHERAGI